MLSESEVACAIAECEETVQNYQGCEKLATLYTIYDHLFGEREEKNVTEVREVIGEYGDTPFLQGIAGKDSKEAWLLMDELMNTLSLLAPRIYNGILSRL